MEVVKAFYDDNDAADYDASLALLTPDVTLVSWAEGVNGRHWAEIHLQGKEQIRPLLAKRGLRRTNGEAGRRSSKSAGLQFERSESIWQPGQLHAASRPAGTGRQAV